MEETDPFKDKRRQAGFYDIPVEIWNKIFSFLKPSTIIAIKDVCSLWFDLTQSYIANGKIKSDFYVSIQSHFYIMYYFYYFYFLAIQLHLIQSFFAENSSTI